MELFFTKLFLQLWMFLPPLISSTLIGATIGYDREVKGKEAGLKTFILITCSSTIFTIMSIILGSDPSRIAAQIVSGVGFLGAGAIFKNRDKIEGLTTAAYIWTAAALGMMTGLKYSLIAIILTIGMLICMQIVGRLEHLIHKDDK